MAMEIKTLEVANDKETATIEFWSQFGWQLKSSQRVYNKNSHLEQRGNDTYSVTETVDFTKLVFERDKNGPNYKRIAELEERYFQTEKRIDAAKGFKITKISEKKEWAEETKPDMRGGFQKVLPFLILGVSAVVLFALEKYDYTATMIVQGICLAMIPGSFIIKGIVKKNALKKAIEGTNEASADKLNQLYEKYRTGAVNNNRAVLEMEEILKELETLV